MQPSHTAQPERMTVGEEDDGRRVDRVVADWRGLSRAAVLRLMDAGAVECNGRVLARQHKGDLLQLGDTLTLDATHASGEAPKADPAMPLEVLSQGEGWLIVNKPAGVAVRPHAIDETGTVLNAVAGLFPSVVGVGEGGLRSGVVHRLDTDTSGALVVATEQRAWDRLRRAFEQHLIVKKYEALVHGVPPETGESVKHLAVLQHAPSRVGVVIDPKKVRGARACGLTWRVLESFGGHASRVEIHLGTGFLHQVRVMMSVLGHPLIGDALYGAHGQTLNAPRHMLHARSLAYEEVVGEAPLPTDYEILLASLRG